MQIKKTIILFDIDYTLFRTKLFKKSNLQKYVLYKEVIDILTRLSRVASLGIFSEGEFVFQKKKLTKTDIEKYFINDNIHIHKNKEEVLNDILSKYKDGSIFLIDDKLTILNEAKKILPSIFTIWVKRGEYAEKQKNIMNFKPDAVVTNLKKIMIIIENNLNKKN
ncbi:MAG: hypothetical protein M1268_00515 [Patescibacteria group bacterium]|nr:hypothetical protein [Patescibacteria group bacterium]